jgi:hypothetical protein
MYLDEFIVPPAEQLRRAAERRARFAAAAFVRKPSSTPVEQKATEPRRRWSHAPAPLPIHPFAWMWERGWSYAPAPLPCARRAPANGPSIKQIIKETASAHQMGVADMLSQSRRREYVLPRQIAMYLAKTMTDQSLPEIGRRMGGRDHTTILHGVRKIRALLDTDRMVAARVAGLRRAIGGDA